MGSYNVDINKYVTDPKVYGILTNGYPYKSISELGLQSEEQAYYATKMALWCYLRYNELDQWKALSPAYEPVEAALKKIYTEGMKNTSIPVLMFTATADAPMAAEDSKDKTYLSQTFTVTANVDIKSYSVAFDGNTPSGTKITDINNNAKTTLSAGDKFKILLTKSSATTSGEVKTTITGELKTNAVLYGVSKKAGYQDYACTRDPISLENTKVSATYSAQTTETPPPSETPPPTETTPPGKLTIKKVEYGTTKGLAGAIFRVTDATGGIIGDYITDGSGQITLSLDKAGAYYIDEITAPAGYQLDINQHKDVVIIPDKTALVTFSNHKSAGIEITKVDADTNEKLRGAVIRIAYDGGHKFVDVITDTTGKAVVSDLPAGTYTVTEITAPSGYILDSTPHPIKLVDGVVSTITLNNHAKPGIIIKKYDEKTGLPLPGAEFSVKKKDGSIVYEGITDKDGKIKVEGLTADWYTITELAAPGGYIITTPSKDVKLEEGKTVEVKFDNRQKPALAILKLDSQTNLPLAGAKFKVEKTEDKTVSEYVTDEKGMILIKNLDEAVYTVTEVEAPTGYILNPQIKNIALEWGMTKTLVYTNTRKPSLEILKVDEATKTPLAGAKFRVTKTEGNTTSEYITDSKGRIFIENLQPGIYSVSEIVAPDGYLLEEQRKDVELTTEGGTKTVIFTNKKRPVLEIKKIDTRTGEALAGARFKVVKTEDNTVSEYITDASGVITINKLDAAIYTVSEIVAPDGYILDTQHKDIELQWGKTSTLIYEDMRKPTLIITKTNGLTYKPIPDTTYKIEYEGANGGIVPLGTFRTDKNGQIVLPKVNPGWYIITEVKAAPGFSISSNPVTRKYLAPGENAYTVSTLTQTAETEPTPAPQAPTAATSGITVTSGSDYNLGEDIINYPLNSIVIKKVSAVTGEMLAGAAFEVRKVSEDISGNSGTVIGRYTTNNSGIIVITGLDAGAYIVEEVQAPANYLISENSKQQAWLKPDGTSIVEVAFANIPYGSILVTKVDAKTNKPLANARFKVTDGTGAAAGNTNGEFVTNENGEFLVLNLKPGAYVVTEIQAPENYVIDTTPQTVNVGVDGKVYKVSFKNNPISTLVILKKDSVTKEPLAGAQFKVTTAKGNVVGTGNGIFTSNANGTITIPNLEKGAYIVEEIKAPDNYILENQAQTVELDYGKTYTVEFFNSHKSGLIIKKTNDATTAPLAGAKFKVTHKNGEIVGEYTTDKDGMIQFDNLSPDWYSIVETKAPDGFLLDSTPKDVQVTANQLITVEFTNKPMSGLIIKKTNYATTAPLAGAKFKVTHKNGKIVGEYVTDKDGLIQLDNLAPDWYSIVETKAPEGFLLDSTPKDVQVTANQLITVEFTNKPMSGLQISKIDAATKAPLKDATFIVYKKSGDVVGQYQTDGEGLIILDKLSPGWYKIVESKAPNGYLADDTPKDIEVTSNQFLKVVFENKKLTSLQIKKVDEVTGAPLAGAEFFVEKQNGEHVGQFTTDKDGFINIPTLTPDWYVVRETKAPVNYILDSTPKTVQVKTEVPTIVTFTNKPLAGLQIKKINSETHQPIANVEFAISKMSGEKIGNFKTDTDGLICVANLADGYYYVTEVKAADGYILDSEPKTVQITWGKPTLLEVENEPASGLLIIKTDMQTGKPLAGVTFDVKRADGQRVQGSILDQNLPNTPNNSPNKNVTANGDISGSYVTDQSGRIIINHLAPGEYHITETKALPGYELDKNVYTATVTAGKQAVFQLQNKQLAGLRLKKIDAVTGQGIYDVEFRVYDELTNKEVGGPYRTDNNGIIDFSGILQEGRYKILETSPAEGYMRDDVPKTVEFKAVKMTEIVWANQPYMGQIQILKTSAEDNEQNGLPKGTPLANAVFEVYRYKTGTLIDQFTTGPDGKGVSKPLPLGRYIIKEVRAPQYYKISDKQLDIEIEFPSQILKFEFTDEAANTGVSIKKIGPKEIMGGQQIRYDFKEIHNTSTVPLSDFFYRDILPTDAVRLDKIVTGTFNQSVKYKIMYKTNKNDYRVMADNLSSTKNNVIDASPESLGLYSDEYVTEFMVVFGNVKAGFCQVEQPYIFVNVKKGLPNGYRFANKVDIGGKYQNEWVIGNSTCVTTIYNPTPEKLPRTGY